jgi:hypothetical protein
MMHHSGLHGCFAFLLALEPEQASAFENQWVGVGWVGAFADYDRRGFVALVHELGAGRFHDASNLRTAFIRWGLATSM